MDAEDDFTTTVDGAAAHAEELGEPLVGRRPRANVLTGGLWPPCTKCGVNHGIEPCSV